MILHHCKILPLNWHSSCVISFLGGTEYNVRRGSIGHALTSTFSLLSNGFLSLSQCMQDEWNKYYVNPQMAALATYQVLIIHKNKSIFSDPIFVSLSKENPKKINVKILILIISGQSGYVIFTLGLNCIFQSVTNNQKTLL